MLNVQSTLQHMNIPHTSVTQGISALRGRLQRAPSTAVGATRFIHDVLDVDVKFVDDNRARITAFAVLEAVIKSNCQIGDSEELVKQASERADKFMSDPMNSWMFVTKASISEEAAVVDGMDTKVAVNADGKIKRGGKQILANEMYRKHIGEATTPMPNTDFVQLLCKELGMTIAGARTYAYNASKAFKSA